MAKKKTKEQIEKMREKIRKEVQNNYDMLHLLEAQVKPGYIVRIQKGVFILVVTLDRHSGNSFYYVPCTRDGKIKKAFDYPGRSAANYINNSIMLSSCAPNAEIVGKIELKSQVVFHNCKKYEWFLTGDFSIDAYMSNLDARWSLFSDTCNESQLKKYREQENINYHQENGHFVGLHAKFFRDDKLMRIGRGVK